MMDRYSERAKEVVGFILKSNKAPNFREFTDVNKDKSFGTIMIEDLGDSLPFMFFVGEKKNEKFCDIAEDSAKFLISKFQYKNGLFMTSNKLKFLEIYNFDKMTDLSLGINLMYRLTGDKYYLNSSIRFFDRLISFIKDKNSFIPLLYTNKLKAGLNFSTGKFGLYIEELCNLYNFTNDKKYLKSAKDIAKLWISNKFFNEYGLFPFVYKPKMLKPLSNILFKRKFGFGIDTAMSSKANTNLVHGLNELYRITNDNELYNALKKWYTSIRIRLMGEDGSLFNIWDNKGKYKFLGCDHAVIDCFLNFNRITKDKQYLKDAEKIANFWMYKQDSSGLIQQGVEGYKVCADPKLKYGDNPKFFRLDPQTDMFVMLIRLYKITRKGIYLKNAKKLIDGMIRYHGYKSGFVDVLDEKKNKKDNIIETKFLFLVTKALMFESYKDKNDKKVESLLRDR